MVSHLSDLRAENQDPVGNSIDADSWVKHFKALHSSLDSSFEKHMKEIDNLVHYKEENSIFNELDYKITTKEISSSISSLKFGKAKGLDLISNEMLKFGQTQLLPCLLQLFNLSFSNGIYPEKWAEGYILPNYKADDPSDPNNYRGTFYHNNQ